VLAVAAVTLMAIVGQDQVSLHSAPRDSSPKQAVLWQGDVLEVRGEKQGYIQVYDHRRERAGYVRAWQVRRYSVEPATAPDLLAVVRFLRDAPGSEALGIAHAAMFLSAADAKDIGPEIFDALGTMADRLARRASTRYGKSDDSLAAHLEVAQSYGLKFPSYEREGRTQICYEGEAFRRVLALGGTAEQNARAALALTRPECIDPDLSAPDRVALDGWRTEVLDRVDLKELQPYLANRMRLRRAAAWASLAFDRARKHDPSNKDSVQQTGERALDELAAIDKSELAEDDKSAYAEAAVRVGASRWAAEADVAPKASVQLATVPGEQPGETCIVLLDDKHDAKQPLFRKCTFGVVWSASARMAPHSDALALAVQPIDSWRELWIFRRSNAVWDVDVLVPSTGEPDLGYLEFAGWSPDGSRLLAAREVRKEGNFVRSFEILKVDTLEIEKQASSPEALTPFHRWQSPDWKALTVTLR
jgi:hypothetical protein